MRRKNSPEGGFSRACCCLLVLVWLSSSLLGPPTADGGTGGQPTVMTFTVGGTHGYRLLVVAVAPPASSGVEEGEVGLFLSRGKTSSVSYADPHATVTAEKISADLGDLGRISVERVPTGRTKAVHPSCLAGRKDRVEIDRYLGTIRLHGEEGFTEVEAKAAGGTVDPACGGGSEGGRPATDGLPGTRLAVSRKTGAGGETSFSIVQERPGRRTLIAAEIAERHDALEIHRAVGVIGQDAALVVDRGRRSATVEPPAPFSGSGHFKAGPGSDEQRRGTWTGDLAVDLPGHADVLLVGAGSRATLEHSRR